MYRRILPLLLFGSLIVAYADSATQTDWSGGSGTYGPVFSWSDEYHSGVGINTFHIEGTLILSRDALTTTVEHYIDPSASSQSLWPGDIDGDGDVDLVTTHESSGEFIWWENYSGPGLTWIEHLVDTVPDYASFSYTADINGDGHLDILGTDQYSETIIWSKNVDGSGLVWQSHIVEENFSDPYSIYSEDIDGDGDMDIICGCLMTGDGISWWEITEYSSCGELVSSALYLGNDPGWGNIDWTCEEPAGTSVSFQVRACDSPDSTGMGVWSDTLHSPCSLTGILDENDSFFQYKVILHTSNPSVTPALEDVTVTWDPLGIEGGEPSVLQLLPFAPNPATGNAVIRFSLPEQATVELRVFDLTGRLVSEIQGDEYSPGFHDILVGDLSPGIYFCRMTSGDFTATQRFVVIE